MPLIDSNGLADGDRINSCSKMAQLYYPRMMAASNGYGRIRIDYRQIIATVFPKWKDADLPSEPELLGYFQEYAHNHLIFLYSSASQLWGQWDAKAGTFGKYQTVADKRSPVPPEKEFLTWIKDNREHSHKESVAMAHFELVIPEENLKQGREKLRQNSGNVSTKLPHGVGVGAGEGVTCDVYGENPSSNSRLTDSVFKKAWEQYPRKVGKGAAKRAWLKAATKQTGELGPDAEEIIYQRVMTYAAVCKRTGKEKQFTPHMATWLNEERFLDDPTEWAVTGGDGNGSASRATEKLNRNRQAIISGLTGQGDCPPVGHHVSDVQRDRTDTGAGVVLEGSPQRAKSATAT